MVHKIETVMVIIGAIADDGRVRTMWGKQVAESKGGEGENERLHIG